MIRLFAAVSVPDEIAEALLSLQTGVDGARWRPIEAFHITLRFFGDTPENLADDLDQELRQVSGRGFDLALMGVGAFGEGRDLHALWAGVAESQALRTLAARCERAARRAGLAPDTRNYAPHLTLAYLRGAAPDEVGAWIGRHNLLHSPPFRIDSFGLFSSWSGKGGSSYRRERTYGLA
jgi:2'-5' RNA ligase